VEGDAGLEGDGKAQCSASEIVDVKKQGLAARMRTSVTSWWPWRRRRASTCTFQVELGGAACRSCGGGYRRTEEEACRRMDRAENDQDDVGDREVGNALGQATMVGAWP
jgi:hypothetical protein